MLAFPKVASQVTYWVVKLLCSFPDWLLTLPKGKGHGGQGLHSCMPDTYRDNIPGHIPNISTVLIDPITSVTQIPHPCDICIVEV